MNTLPSWCTRAPGIQAYVARPFGNESPERQVIHDALGTGIAKATDAFLENWQQSDPTYVTHDYSLPAGWLALSNSLVNGYKKSHWNLVQTDTDYVKALGTALDAYESFRGAKVPAPTFRRWRMEIHELFIRAVGEGIPTSVAMFAVAPKVVARQYPTKSKSEILLIANSLLPSLVRMGILQARLSQEGNDTRLDRVSVTTERIIGKRDYKNLTYVPEAFTILYDHHGNPYIADNASNYAGSDLMTSFKGCPAVLNASVTKINRLIAQIIVSQEAYEQVLGVDGNTEKG